MSATKKPLRLDAPDCPEALTACEVAGILGVSRDTVYERARRGEIPHLRIGTRTIFPRRSLIRWLEGCEATPGAHGLRLSDLTF